MRLKTIALGLALLTSCVGGPPPTGPKSSLNKPPSPQKLAAAEYGLGPLAGYEAQIRKVVETLLKDPESARYRFGAPEKGWLPRYHFDHRVPGQPHRHGHVLGWKVHFAVNAKNSYGGYAGESRYEAFFQDGQLRGILQPGKYKDIFGYPMWNLVADVPAAPR